MLVEGWPGRQLERGRSVGRGVPGYEHLVVGRGDGRTVHRAGRHPPAVGMHQAWRMTAALQVQITGPYQIKAEPAALA